MDKNSLLKKIDLVAKLISEMRNELMEKPLQEPEISRTDEQVSEFVAKKLCLKCGKHLGSKSQTRGIHESCYQQLRRAGEIDRALVNGRILPIGKPGPKSADALEPIIEKVIAKKRIANDKTSGRNSNQNS